MIGVLVAVAMSAPAAAVQRDTRDNLAVVDPAATAELLERADSVIEEVFSYDYRELAERERSVAELTTEDFQEELSDLFEEVDTEGPRQQLTLTYTVAASAAQWLHDGEAEVLLFLDQKSVSGVTGQDSGGEAMLLASFELSGDRWLLDSVDTFEAR